VVGEPIQERGRHLGIPEDLRPLPEGEIGGDDQGGALVELGDEMEEQLPSRRLLSETATVTDTYSLDAFGRQMSASGSTVNPYRFGAAWGYMTDTPGSGLLQLGARFYWPEVGRFVQQDPAGDGMNWYPYVESNPLVLVDPEGEKVYAPWSPESMWYHVGTNDEGAWAGAPQGAAVVADAFNPLGDWYADAGAYQRCDPIMAASRGMADMSVAALAEIPTGLAAEALAPRVAGLLGRLRGLVRIGSHRLPPSITTRAGVPRKLAGRLHQDGVRVPHLNIGRWHVIPNRYNWYKPWKWFVG
jgi:RHS repeat-associated protein